MQLFKSQLLPEPGRDTRVLTYREPAFGPRYGRRVASRRTVGKSDPTAGDDVAVVARDPQGGREWLRGPARFDRAA